MRAGIACILLVACGAKSGLEIEVERRADAGAPLPFDSGLIPFPCRWAPLGIDIEVARSPTPFRDIAGSLHPERSVLVARGVTGMFFRGSVADVGPRPAILHQFALSPDLIGVAADRDEFLLLHGCTSEWRNADFALVGHVALEPGRCSASTSSVPGTLDFVRSTETGTEVRRQSATATGRDAVRIVGDLGVRSRSGLAVDAPLGMFVVLDREGELWVHHQRDGRVESIGPVGGAEPFGLAPDAIGGGAILVRARGIDRITTGPLRLDRMRDLDGLRIASRTIAWSTSEVVFVLDDGSLAFMPYFGSDLRIEPGAVPPEFTEAEVVLRNGGAEGGILYTLGDGGEFLLFYRPLVCNR